MNTPSKHSSKDMEPLDDDSMPTLASWVPNIPEDTNIISQETFLTQKEAEDVDLYLIEGKIYARLKYLEYGLVG